MTAPADAAHPPSPRRGRRSWLVAARGIPGLAPWLVPWLAPGIVFGVAFAVRIAPLIRTGSLTGVLDLDDGTFFSASAHVLHGQLLYRDVVFDHPPGIAILLAPFVALAAVAGDVTGMTAARLAVVTVGALNATLITLYLRRYTPAWALVGGLAYAVWRLPAGAERSVLFEPLLTLALLAGLLLLGEHHPVDAHPQDRDRPGRDGPGGRRGGFAGFAGAADAWFGERFGVRPGGGRAPLSAWRVAAAGALLGIALTVAPRAAPEIAVLTVFLLATRGLRTAAGWVTAAAAAAAAVTVPMALAEPGEFVQQVSRGQLDSNGDIGVVQHLQRFSDLARLGGYQLPMAVDIMLATCVVVTVATVALIAWWQPEAQLVVLLMAVQCAVVATSPAYDPHRFALAAPMIVIATASAAHRYLPDPWRGALRLWLAPATALALVGLALSAVHNVVPRPPDPGPLRAFAAAHRCVWFETASLAIAADHLTPLLEAGCPSPVDRHADLADLGVPIGFDVGKARRTRALQVQLIQELDECDAAVVSGNDVDDSADALLGDSYLGEEARRALEASFVPAGTYGHFTLWVHR